MRSWWLAAVVLAGCRGEITAAVPFEEGTKSVVLAIEHGPKLEVHAFDGPPAGEAYRPLRLTFEDDAEVKLTALLYSATLAESKLTPGLLTRAATGQESIPLPETPRKYSAVLSGRDLSGWTAVERLEGELAAFMIPKPNDPTICDRVAVTTLPFDDVSQGFWNAAVADRDTAFLIHDRWTSGVFAFGRSGSLAALEIPGITEAVELASDHRGTVYVSVAGFDVFQIDAEGHVLARTPIPFYAARLALSADGTMFAADPNGISSVELVRGSTVTIAGPQLPAATIYGWIVVDRDRIGIRAPDGIYVLDRGEWRTELRADLDQGELFGDRDLFGYVHPALGVMVRNEQTRMWETIEEPSPSATFYTGRALGRGRMLIGGDGGLTRVFNDGEWCNVVSSTLRSFDAADYDPQLKIGVLATHDASNTQFGMWLDFPDDF